MSFTSWISNALLNEDFRKDSLSFFHFFFPYGGSNSNWQMANWLSFLLSTQFRTVLPKKCLFLLQLSQIPSNDNGNESMSTSLWSGIAMRSIWREAASLLSSADQLSTWELPLPGSPSKLSPGCLWVSSCCHLPLTWAPSRKSVKKKI